MSSRRVRSRSAGRMGYSKRARSMVVRGYTRSVGLYGRFNIPARRPEQKAVDWHYAFSGAGVGQEAYPLKVPTWRPVVLNPAHLFNATTSMLPAVGAGSNHLLCISQGAGLDARIGRKIQLRSLEIQGSLWLPPCVDLPMAGENASCQSEIHHMWIVIDTQVNGDNTTQAAQIWQGQPSSLGALVNDVNALRNIANSSRFRILKHIVTPLVRPNITFTGALPDRTFSGDGIQKQLNCFLKLNLPIEYANFVPDGSIETLRDNGLFIFTATTGGLQCAVVPYDEGLDPQPKTTMHETYNIRIRYTDV